MKGLIFYWLNSMYDYLKMAENLKIMQMEFSVSLKFISLWCDFLVYLNKPISV